MGYITTTKDYWIAPNAVYITLNALGQANRVQGSVASGTVISCYIESITPGGDNGDGLLLDNGRNPKRWPLSLSPTYFNNDEPKYVYAAIPRKATISSQAVIVFPSEQLDIYGKNSTGEQIGSVDYFYVYLQGIISAPSGTPLQRSWTKAIGPAEWGSLGTYADIVDMTTSSEWYNYDKTTGIVTFLKNIIMKAGSSFHNLFLAGKELTSVADETTPVDSDTAVATPDYVSKHFLSKLYADTAAGLITFLKGLKLGSGAAYGLDATGDGLLRDLVVRTLKILEDATIGGTLTTHDLTVTGTARFFELLIDEIRHVGGTVVLSHARMKTDLVMLPTEGIHQQGTAAPIVWVPSTDISGHIYPSGMEGHVRLLWLADDGSRRTGNQFCRGDQVLCQQSHMLEAGGTDAANKYWWKLVIGASETPIDVEDADGTTRSYHWIEVDAASGLGTMVANAGDEVVTLGWDATVGGVVTDMERAARQSAIILASGFTPDTWNNVKAPCIAEYAGINSFTLEGKLVSVISPHGNVLMGDFTSESGKNYEEIVNNMSDGMSEHSIWFGSGQPTLDNAPASAWETTDVRKAHVGDLYFDTDEEPASEGGASWRFMAKNNNTAFVWERADDRYTVAALTKIQNVASDGIITGGMEKQGVLVRWNKAKADYLSAIRIAESMVMTGTEVYKKLIAAWHILYMYLNNAVDSDDTSPPPYQIKNEHIGESWTLYQNEQRFTFESFLYVIPAGAAGWEYVWKTFDDALAAMLGDNGLAMQSVIESLGNQINLSVKRGDLEDVGMHLDDTDVGNPHIDMVGNEIRTFPSGANRKTETPRFVLSGTELKVFNPETSQLQIQFGVVDGNVVMRYYNREGRFLYDLGPQGIIYSKSQDAEIIIQKLADVTLPTGTSIDSEPDDATMMQWICYAVAYNYSAIKSALGSDHYHVYTPVNVGLYPAIPPGTYSFKTVNVDTGEEGTKPMTFESEVTSDASMFSDDKWMSEVLIQESDGNELWLLGNLRNSNFVYVTALSRVWLGEPRPDDYTSVINIIRSLYTYSAEYENIDWDEPVYYREIRFYYRGVLKKTMKVFFNID